MKKIISIFLVTLVTLFAQSLWTKDRNLQKLIKIIKEDETFLCSKDAFELSRLENLFQRYKSSLDPYIKEELIDLAKRDFALYIHRSNNGCFTPQDFLDDKEYASSEEKNGSTLIFNPILSSLKRSLEDYHRLAQKGGWKKIEIKDILYLRPGMEYEAIPLIRNRLAIEGYYKGDVTLSKKYDKKLQKAVQNFQLHHGIKSDGVIGPSTIDAMNIPVEEKIERVLLNIERFRWFMRDDRDFIFVNIPGFFLQYYQNAKVVLSSKVIVGRRSRPTPLMRDEIRYSVLNPYWRAPKTIIQKDILPYLKKGDFKYLEKLGIVIALDRNGKKVIEPSVVEWQYFEDNETLPFIFLQKPGPKNFLGYVKFMFPNRFDVYLHDTDNRGLFRYPYRALSSGCVRVAKPIELFSRLFKSEGKEFSYRDIFERLSNGANQKIFFTHRIPLYLAYITTWRDEQGLTYFYPDIYGIDQKMRKTLYKGK